MAPACCQQSSLSCLPLLADGYVVGIVGKVAVALGSDILFDGIAVGDSPVLAVVGMSELSWPTAGKPKDASH